MEAGEGVCCPMVGQIQHLPPAIYFTGFSLFARLLFSASFALQLHCTNWHLRLKLRRCSSTRKNPAREQGKLRIRLVQHRLQTSDVFFFFNLPRPLFFASSSLDEEACCEGLAQAERGKKASFVVWIFDAFSSNYSCLPSVFSSFYVLCLMSSLFSFFFFFCSLDGPPRR